MIAPAPGMVFTGVAEGDLRHDEASRLGLNRLLGLSGEWATCRQVHGADVHRVTSPGVQGEGDAMWTDTQSLPLAVFTADCLGVAVVSERAIGLAHAGWRGVRGGVVGRLAETMSDAGHHPTGAVIGPGIGPCCFEVGDEVAEFFGDHLATTTWGTTSVDLPGAVTSQLGAIPVMVTEGCTRHDYRWFSHRRDGTTARQVALAWIP